MWAVGKTTCDMVGEHCCHPSSDTTASGVTTDATVVEYCEMPLASPQSPTTMACSPTDVHNLLPIRCHSADRLPALGTHHRVRRHQSNRPSLTFRRLLGRLRQVLSCQRLMKAPFLTCTRSIGVRLRKLMPCPSLHQLKAQLPYRVLTNVGCLVAPGLIKEETDPLTLWVPLSPVQGHVVPRRAP